MFAMRILGALCVTACIAGECWAGVDTPLGPNGSMGVEIAKDGGFEKARRYLEDGIAETPDNPVLYEYLGLSYLDCASGIDMKRCLGKATEYMEKAIALGGRAALIADRYTGKGGVFNTVTNKGDVAGVVRGMLYIYPDRVEFVPKPGTKNDAETIVIPGAEVKDGGTGMNKAVGSTVNTFHIKVKGATYNFRTANFSAEEAQLVFHLMEKSQGVKAPEPKKGKQ
jgi:hypothetical protein